MDYYATLGVAKAASDADIKAAYRALALKWHPDRNLDNVEEATKQFKAVSEAFEVLTDPVKRLQYDQLGYVGRRPPGPPPRPQRPKPPPPPPPPPKPQKENFWGHPTYSQADLDAINCSFIDGSQTNGRSIVTYLHVDPSILDRGGSQMVNIKRRNLCRLCAGDGYMMKSCPVCGGRRGPQDNMGVPTWACETCDGVGAVKTKCSRCNGDGVSEWEIVQVRATIPPRSKVGYSVLIYGEGEAAPGKAPGNVRVILV